MDRNKVDQLQRALLQEAMDDGEKRWRGRQFRMILVRNAVMLIGMFLIDRVLAGRAWMRADILALAVLLGIFVLEAYLEAKWRWQDVTKKFGNLQP